MFNLFTCVSSLLHRSLYLLDTHILDRARAHLQSLQKAEAQGKTPAKMAIAIKPTVLEKEDARFKTEWPTAIQDAEKNLSKTIQAYLMRWSTRPPTK